MPIKKVGFKRLLTGLGILIIVLLALAFILGILSLKRTQEIVSDDFQQQQLILAKTTGRQIEDGLGFLRRELRILAYSPAIQYLEDVAWANRMKVSFDELSKMGVVAIERIDFTGDLADKAYVLDAAGPRLQQEDFSQAPEVAWARVKDVSEVLSVGQEVEVVVKGIDWDKDRISFSLKDTLADPWEEAATAFPEGSYQHGKVARLTPFGAFVTLASGVDGLIHISKLGGGKRIQHPKEVLSEGQEVEVKVEGIDREQKRISLALASVSRAEQEQTESMEAFRKTAAEAPKGMGTLGDLLKAKLNKG